MTSEEIKCTYKMKDILLKYGLVPNRAGFIQCPFHQGDHTASMKIYQDSYYCFGCGSNGDIFSFIQEMDKLSFKEAFQSLGGTYHKPTFSSRLAIYKAQKEREMREKRAEKEWLERQLNLSLIQLCRKILSGAAPLSDAWCDAYNLLQKQLYRHGELNGIPY